MKKNKKIIHFHPVEKYANIFVRPLMDAEKKNYYDTILICSDESNLIADFVIPYELKIKNLFFLIKSFINIKNILIKHKPDIIVSHNSRSSLLPLFASWQISIPKRIYFNHGVPHIGYTGITRFFLKMLERMNCNFSTEVITVSSDMRYRLQKLAPKTKVDFIYFGSACGINLKEFYPNQKPDWSFRDAHQINRKDFLVVYIGRPNKRKGFKKCMDLWVKYFHSSEYKLVLCGISESNVLKLISYMPKNIICLEFTDSVPQILREANCLILPSYHEGFSYAALEALASRCIVLANNIEGVRNLIINNVNGILVDDNDINSFRENIELIRTGQEKYLDMQAEGLLQVKKFSRDIFLNHYLLKLSESIS